MAFFGPLLTLFKPYLMQKTPFLALLGKNFPEKLSGLSVKGGGGGTVHRVPPLPAKGFLGKWLSVKGVMTTPSNHQISYSCNACNAHHKTNMLPGLTTVLYVIHKLSIYCACVSCPFLVSECLWELLEVLKANLFSKQLCGFPVVEMHPDCTHLPLQKTSNQWACVLCH